MAEGKRNRGLNFSSSEIRSMMNFIFENIDVIENKQTDGATLNQKRAAWNKVEEKFNAVCGTNRNVESIKVKYDNIKRNLKKKIADSKHYSCGTGGGVFKTVKVEDYEEILLGYLQPVMTGLASNGDSDSTVEPVRHAQEGQAWSVENADTSGDINQNVMLDVPEPPTYNVQNKWQPLKTKKSKPLIQENVNEVDEQVLYLSELQDSDGSEKENLADLQSPEENNTYIATPSRNKCKVINKRPLRIKAKTQQSGDASKSIIELTEWKKELTEKNIHIAREELRKKETEWTFLQEEVTIKKEILQVQLQQKKIKLDELHRDVQRKEELHKIAVEEAQLKVDLLRVELRKFSNK